MMKYVSYEYFDVLRDLWHELVISRYDIWIVYKYKIWWHDYKHDMKQLENCIMSWYGRPILVVKVKSIYYGACSPMNTHNDMTSKGGYRSYRSS